MSWIDAERECEADGMTLPRLESFEDLGMFFDFWRMVISMRSYHHQLIVFIDKVLTSFVSSEVI